MTTLSWAPGTAYALGEIVQPRTTTAPVQTAIPNAGFETGTANWAGIAGSWSIDATLRFEGTNSVKFNGAGVSTIENSVMADVTPGQTITLKARTRHNFTLTAPQKSYVGISWYTSGSVLIKTDYGTMAVQSQFNSWQQILVAATAPATAAFAKPILKVDCSASNIVHFDSLSWDQTYAGPIGGFLYQVTTAGTSAGVEPVWPIILAATVADGSTLVWKTIQSNRVVWTSTSILQSGAAEPIWPTTPGALIADNTIQWECVTQEVKDVNCPRTKVIAVGASKVFAIAGDVVRFCSTVNPLDWTSANDAGYLATGLHQYGNNEALVLGIYRGNLCVWSSSTFQMWQIDPDPANMALLDQMEGIGSTHPLAAQPVGEELFYMAANGVRSVGISAASDNLETGDIGKPVDSLIKAEIDADRQPIGLYVPSLGQLWMMFVDREISGYLDLFKYDGISFIINFVTPTPVYRRLTATGGIRPYRWSKSGWPAWAVLDKEAGYISGTPSGAGTTNGTVTVTDSANQTKTFNIRFTG